MKQMTLGNTRISIIQSAFGGRPVQSLRMNDAISLIRKAYDGGFQFYVTSRSYTDSEEKLGEALCIYPRENYFLSTNTLSLQIDGFWKDLNTSLNFLKTDYVDIYSLYCSHKVYKPNDGTGLYECLLKAKDDGFIRHLGCFCDQWYLAKEAIESGLYEVIEYPLSYLSSEEEIHLIDLCQKYGVGMIAVDVRVNGLIKNSELSMAYMSQFDCVCPVWNIPFMAELDEWLTRFQNWPEWNKNRMEEVHNERILFMNKKRKEKEDESGLSA